MATVIIKGFRSDLDAQTFIEWFEGQGEQDQDEWFECRQEEGLDVESQFTDCIKTYPLKQDTNGNWVLELEPRV